MIGKTVKEITSEIQSNKRTVFDEQDIPNQGYNLAHIQENWVDDGSRGTYLGLSQWCLCSNPGTDIPDQDKLDRLPLPESGKFMKSHVLFGTVPPNSNAELIPIPIVIKQPKCWVIDRSHHLRGIWIQSSYRDHWYWLKDPSSEAVPSQETLHTELRAKLGLLSNLIDIIQESSDGKPFNYIPLIAKRTPQTVHKMLTPSSTQLKYFSHLPLKSDIDREYPFTVDILGQNYLGNSYPLLNNEPFDLELLYTCADFIQQHLGNMTSYLHESCEFIMGLSEMQTQYTNYINANPFEDAFGIDSALFKRFSHQDYVTSASKSEQRSFRHPWGEVAHPVDIQPNRWIEFIVQYRLTDANHIPQLTEGFGPQDQDLSNTVQCVMRGLKEKNLETPLTFSKLTMVLMNPITPMMESKGYSSVQLCLALRGLASIVSPTPSLSELTNRNMILDQISKFNIAEDKAADLADIINGDYPDSQGVGHVPSLEWIYLIVECTRRSGPKILKSIFKAKTKTGIAPFVIIFKHWLPLAMHRIQTASDDYKRNQPIELLLIQSVMQLIVDCTVIHTMNQITILTKLSVDWFYIVDKTLDFAITNKLMDAVQSVKLAKRRLDSIKADSLLLIEATVIPTGTAATIAPVAASEVDELKDKEIRQKRLSHLMTIARNSAGSSIRKPTTQLSTDALDSSHSFIDLSHDNPVVAASSTNNNYSLQLQAVPSETSTFLGTANGPISSKSPTELAEIPPGFGEWASKTTNSKELPVVTNREGSRDYSGDATELSTSTTSGYAGWSKNSSCTTSGYGAWSKNSSKFQDVETLMKINETKNEKLVGPSATVAPAWDVQKEKSIGNDLAAKASDNSYVSNMNNSIRQSDGVKELSLNNMSGWGGWTKKVTGNDKEAQTSTDPNEAKKIWAIATKLEGSCPPSWGSKWQPPKEAHVNNTMKPAPSTKSSLNSTNANDFFAPNKNDTSMASTLSAAINVGDKLTGHKDGVQQIHDLSHIQSGQVRKTLENYHEQGQDTFQILRSQHSKNKNPARLKRAHYESNASDNLPKLPKSDSEGNGRGRLRTLPSWMTKPSTDKEEICNVRSEQMTRRDEQHTISESPSFTVALQAGRGRGKTLPSWMTEKDTNASSCIQKNCEQAISADISQDSSSFPPMTHGKNSSRLERAQYESNASDNLPKLPQSYSEGNGRGRLKTLPSWMTKPSTDKEEICNVRSEQMTRRDEQHTISESPSFTVAPQAGRGRGKTLPSWMTEKDTNASSCIQKNCEQAISADISQDSSSFPPMTQGRGRGRTLPAWMTETKPS